MSWLSGGTAAQGTGSSIGASGSAEAVKTATASTASNPNVWNIDNFAKGYQGGMGNFMDNIKQNNGAQIVGFATKLGENGRQGNQSPLTFRDYREMWNRF